MPVFKALGREWLLSLDAPKVQAVRDECKVNLAIGGADEFDVQSIASDPVNLPFVLWVLCRKQAEAANISRGTFLETIVGDLSEDAGHALVDAILDFTPSRTRREALREAWKSDLKATELANQITKERLPELMANQDEEVRRTVNEIFDSRLTRSKSATGSPASSKSTRTKKRGAS